MVFAIIQAVTGILLILAILVQNRGTGLGSAFGGTDQVFHTKRGAEKFLHYFSIVMAVLFIVASFFNVLY